MIKEMRMKTTRLHDNKTTSLLDVDYNKVQKQKAKSQSIIRTIFIFIVSNILTLGLAAQSSLMNMNDCMAYAVEHSTSVGKKINALDDAKQDYNSSVASLFPSLSASVSGETNFGRSIDPETNSYTNVSTFNNSYGISGSMPLFAGLQGINTWEGHVP